MPTQAPSVLDIFAAPGGFSQGFREAGYNILAAIDNDPWGYETLSRNHSPRTLVIRADIEKIRISARVDIVVGGPPCQGFSMVGRPKIAHLKRNGERTASFDVRRNSLYKQFVTIVETTKPQFFVMENVPGIVSFDNGRLNERILEDFRKIGYENAEVQILNAADYGVPQIRKRAIYMGNRLGERNPYPRQKFLDQRRHQTTIDDAESWLTVFDAISDLPPLRAGEGSDESRYTNGPKTSYQEIMRENSEVLFNHVARCHSIRDQKIFRKLSEGQKMSDLPEFLRPYRSDIFADKIKKQSWKLPSSAILAHLQKDGLMYVHPDNSQARSFTPREAARLQSFRDSYRFLGPMTQQFHQIGNAVPPLLAMAIATEIKPLLEPLKQPLVKYHLQETLSRISSGDEVAI